MRRLLICLMFLFVPAFMVAAKEVPVTAKAIRSFGDALVIVRVREVMLKPEWAAIRVDISEKVWGRYDDIKNGDFTFYYDRSGYFEQNALPLNKGADYIVVLRRCDWGGYVALGSGFVAKVDQGWVDSSHWYGFPKRISVAAARKKLAVPYSRESDLTEAVCNDAH